MEFLDGAIGRFVNLLGIESADAVAMDLHPGYSNRRLARALSEKWSAEIIEVQHHWAHAASLMAENDLDELVCLTLDGTGYGADGHAWGGEVLRADLSSFDRVAHLQGFPLLGGEMAVRDPRRLAFSLDEMCGIDRNVFEGRDADVLRKSMATSKLTSGMGRLLDALSFRLGACSQRTYDGEPAMRLEPLLESGRNVHGFKADSRSGQIMTADLWAQLNEAKGRPDDLAASFVSAVMDALVELAADEASRRGIDSIGISGGVSYNAPICRMFLSGAEKRGMKAIMHGRLPPGDGGISAGQCAIALKRVS